MAKSATIAPPPPQQPNLETVSCCTISLDELVKPPWEDPRAAPTQESVRELAQTIELYGLLHPIVVIPAEGGGYYRLAGQRRVAALRLLGRTSTSAHVMRDVDVRADPSDLARRVALVENQQRQELDPLREADVVNLLLAGEHASFDSVAADLGRSRDWVVRRSHLKGLSRLARIARNKDGGALTEWPSTWLEELALLPEEDQDVIVARQKEERISSIGTLRQIVHERLQRLGSAPWKLDDAELLPKAGSCVACPKQSLASPALFPDLKKVDLKTALCADGTCWDAKLKVWSTRAIASAKEKHGADVVLVAGPAPVTKNNRMMDRDYDYQAEDLAHDLARADEDRADDPKAKKSGPVVAPLDNYREVKKTDKGAIPALVVEGVGAGTVKYVRERTASEIKKAAGGYSGDSGGYARPKKPPMTMAAKKLGLAKRRHRHVIKAVEDQLSDWDSEPKKIPARLLTQAANDPQWLLDLVGAFGCDELERKAGESEKRLKGGGIKFDKNAGLLERVLATFGAHKLEGYSYARSLASHFEWCRLLWVEALDLEPEWKLLVHHAESDIPTPRSWSEGGGEAKKPAAKKAKPAKAAAPAKAKKKKRLVGQTAAANDQDMDDDEGDD